MDLLVVLYLVVLEDQLAQVSKVLYLLDLDSGITMELELEAAAAADTSEEVAVMVV
jgi:hypothetical protein